MKILAVESSAKSASVAIMENGNLIAQNYQNCGHTHSKTLLPMISGILEATGVKLSDIDVFAVSNGPGSFTGIRIGISVVKGLCFGLETPCIGVSTLEAMAYNAIGYEDTIVCAVMDARRNEVYNALFMVSDGVITRLTDDRALPIAELAEELCDYDSPIVLVGDGFDVTAKVLEDLNIEFKILPEHIRYQSGFGVSLCAEVLMKNGKTPVNYNDISPVYLRLSQAEREKLAKEQ